MNKVSYLIFIFVLLSSYSISQKTQNRNFDAMKMSEKREILERSTDYEKSTFLADSLRVVYDSSRFHIETDYKGKYESGLIFILNLYNRALKMKDDYSPDDSTFVRLQNQIEKEIELEFKNEYQKLINKAEEYYMNGNKSKAIELYERAVILWPSDEKSRLRLDEIKNVK